MKVLQRLQAVPSLAGLRKLNLWLAGLYALELIASLLIGSSRTVPLTTSFLNIDSLQSTSAGSLVLAPATHHFMDLNLLYIVGFVLLVNVVVQVSQATWQRRSYEAGLSAGYNRWRWASYALTTSLLFVVLATLSGVYDAASLLLLFVLGLVLQGLCLASEQLPGLLKRGKGRSMAWLLYGLVWLAGLGMWALVASYLLGANVNGGDHIPAYVYWLAGTSVVTTLGGASLLLRQIMKPRTGQNYRLVERNYLILTFVTTSLLTWQIVIGALTN